MLRLSRKSFQIPLVIAGFLALSGCDKLGFKAPDAGLVVTKLVFDGLQEPEVEWLQESDRVNFDWSPAINATGAVSYEIWLGVDGHWGPQPGQLLVRTKDAFWQYSIPNPEESRALVFMVRACDDEGCESNREQVVMNVTDPNDHEPPEFAGVPWLFATAEDKIELHWIRSPSEDIGKYNVYHSYDLNNPIGSTIDDRFVVNSLSPNTPYKFVVRAQDVNNNEEKNKRMGFTVGGDPQTVSAQSPVTTDAVDRPHFLGLIGLENIPGIPGLTQVLLRWIPTTETITGYQIYRTSAENLNAPFSAIYTLTQNVNLSDSPTASGSMGTYVPWKTGGGVKVNYAIVDLGPSSSGQEYSFVVRAITEGSPNNQERNRLNEVGGPFEAVPPTFGGVSLARAADGDSGFDTGYLEWPTPAADGVYNKFRISVDEGLCSAGFPSPVTVDVESTKRNHNFGALSPETQYHVKVNALYDFQNGDPSDDVLDTNSTCLEFFTQPESPVFAGIKTVLTAEGAAGFDSLDLYWDPATKSFSWYVIEIATDVAFGNVVRTIHGDSAAVDGNYNSQLSNRNTTALLVSGLPQKTQLFVRMYARFVYSLDPSFSLNSNEAFAVKKSATTTPPAPEDDGIHSIDIMKPIQLRINLAEPSNKDNGRDSALYDRYQLWKYCDPGAESAVAAVNPLVTPPNMADLMRPVGTNPSSGLKNFVDSVSTGVKCCYQARAKYDNGAGKTLNSISAKSYQCATPQLIPPDYTGPVFATNPNDATGFTTLNVSWTPLAADENFTRWQVQVSDDPAIKSWTDSPSAPYVKVYTLNQAFDYGVMDGGLGGLSPYKSYTVRVRGVHEFAGSYAYQGEEYSDNATTEPAPPLDDDYDLEAAGATSLRITYTPPSAGLWNNVFIWLTRREGGGEKAEDLTWRTVTTVETNSRVPAYKVPKSTEVDYTISSVNRTVDIGGNLPALIRVTRAAIEAGDPGAKEIIIKGVIQDTTYHTNVVAAQWTPGSPNNYTRGTMQLRTAEPQAVPPSWGGFTIVKDGTANDFNKIQFNFSPATGECDGYRVWVSEDSSLPADFESRTPSREVTGDCSVIDPATLTTTTYDGGTPLVPSTNYFVIAKAFKLINSTYYYSNGGIAVPDHFTATVTPDGDGVKTDGSSFITSVDDAPDRATIEWNVPATGTWNKILVFKAIDPAFDWSTSQNSQAAAQAAAIAKANSWPAQNPDFTLDKTTDLNNGAIVSYNDNTLLSGQETCYVTKAAFVVNIPSGQYTVSSNLQVFCGKSDYSGFTYLGAEKVERVADCSDGTAQFRLHFKPGTVIPVAASIDSWDIYYFESPPDGAEISAALAGGPWMTIPHSDAFRDYVDVGCGGVTRSGSQYFMARYRFVGGPQADSNTMVTTPLGGASDNTAPVGKAHFAKIPKESTDLGYDFFIMAFEASEKSAGVAGTEEVTWDTTKLSKCATRFHQNGTKLDSECRSTLVANIPTRTVQSVPGQTPATGTWHEAYWACRNSSDGSTLMRLPTEKEWRAAVRYTNYTSLVDQTADGSPNCNIGTGAVRPTRADANCQNQLGLFDVAGNVGEWVDARMEYTTGDFTRFGHAGHVFGLQISNGIDSIGRKGADGVDYSGPRFLQIIPPVAGLALQMGSHFGTNAYTSQPGPEAHRWLRATSQDDTTGFRCVAFAKTHTPEMEDMAQPEPPRYTSGEVGSGAAPVNKFVNDEKVERLSISGNVSSADVTLTFYPWTKTVCTNGTCVDKPATDLTYHLYRTQEPNKWDERFVTGWGVAGAGSAYATTTRLDPLSLGSPIASVSCESGTCNLEDTLTGDDAMRMWLYLLAVEDSEGNLHYPLRQRFRTPHLAQMSTTDSTIDLLSNGGAFQWARPFRSEISWRRAAIYPIDEVYQTNLTGVKNVMVHVPMDKSGLDRDFYVQKYEPFVVTTASRGNYYAIGSPNREWFLPAPSLPDSHTWKGDLAECMRMVYANGSPPTSWGAAGSNCRPLAGADSALGSVAGGVTREADTNTGSMMPWGEGVRLCSNSPVEGNVNATVRYYLRPMTSTEYYTASDFGDIDLDGTIDVNTTPGNVGQTIESISHPPYASPYVGTKCNVWKEAGGLHADRPSSDFSECTSRYGAVSMIGNRGEQALELTYLARIKDNGVDAAGFNAYLSFQGSHLNGEWGSGITKVDLNTGLPLCRGVPCSGAPDVNDVFGWTPALAFLAADRWNLSSQSTDRSIVRGGDSKNLDASGVFEPGRHSLFSNYAADRNYWTRCAR